MAFLKIKKIISFLLLGFAFQLKANASDSQKESSRINSFIQSSISRRQYLNRVKANTSRKNVNVPTIKPYSFKSRISMINQNDFPAWIAGFTDGEGCFSVSFNQREKNNLGLDVRPSFSIGQKKYSKATLEKIKDHLGCGFIRASQKDGMYKYEVRSIDDLMNKIIPFFNKYQLETAKAQDFALFKDSCIKINQGQHLNEQGLKQIIENAQKMNRAGKRKYTQEELIKIIDKNKK